MKLFDTEQYLRLRKQDYNPAWVIDSQGAGTYEAVTPNQVSLTFTAPVDFSWAPPQQYQSTMLWFHSLAWLKVIADKFADFEFINAVISDYHQFLFSEESEEILQTLTSRDHLAAEQIRSITYLLATQKVENTDLCREILEKILDWALIPENVKKNNHGMMLVASLLHIPLFFENSRTVEIEPYSTAQLIDIISDAFDSTGLCKENSPIYHRFYITYISRLVAEIDVIPQVNEKLVNFLHETLLVAQRTIEEIALPNGALPPFGDGNLTEPLYEVPTQNSTFYSQESGFYCNRSITGQKYFSVKSGYSSITHKHADDTSIFYWYKGEPIIADAGFYNYDWQDPKTVVVKSQRGHSGAFFTRFDHLYPGALFPLNKPLRVHSSLDVTQENNLTKIRATSTVDERYSVERKIQFSHLNNILMSDTFDGPSEDSGRVSRFLVPGHLGLLPVEQGVKILGENFTMTVVIKNGEYSIVRGLHEDGTPVKGWDVHKQFHSLKPCWLVEITPTANTVVTNLLLKEHTEPENKTSDSAELAQIIQGVKESAENIREINRTYEN